MSVYPAVYRVCLLGGVCPDGVCPGWCGGVRSFGLRPVEYFLEDVNAEVIFYVVWAEEAIQEVYVV